MSSSAGKLSGFRGKTWLLSRDALFRLRRFLPGRARQLVKPLYRRLWRATSRKRVHELAASRGEQQQSLRDFRLVCFPIIDWEVSFQRPQQILARLAARGASVYYLRNDFHASRNLKTETLAEGIIGVRLPGSHRLNMYRSAPPEDMVERWLKSLQQLQGSDTARTTVSIVQWPYWTPLAAAAAERWGWSTIYDCVDEHVAFPNAPSWVREQEVALIRNSDLVIATSRKLFDSCARDARRRALIPNAADFDHFETTMPGKMAPRSGVVVGYIGALSAWFDDTMVEDAARKHPEWTFVLIGLDSGADLRKIRRLDNVRLLGERWYDELPELLHSFDVAVIPFKQTPFIESVNPIKFYEYLAAGKPVVAPSLPELVPHQDLFYPADTPAEFTAALELALRDDNQAKRAKRVAFANENRWEARVDQFEQELLRFGTS